MGVDEVVVYGAKERFHIALSSQLPYCPLMQRGTARKGTFNNPPSFASTLLDNRRAHRRGVTRMKEQATSAQTDSVEDVEDRLPLIYLRRLKKAADSRDDLQPTSKTLII